jgi:transcription termination factor Rho
MPPVLDPDTLSKSPLADLHLLANELGVDGYRRLRKPDLIEAILEHQGDAPADEEDGPEADAPEADAPEADAPEADAPEADVPEADAPEADADVTAEAIEAADEAEEEEPEEEAPVPARTRSRARRGRSRAVDADEDEAEEPGEEEDGATDEDAEPRGRGRGRGRRGSRRPREEDAAEEAAPTPAAAGPAAEPDGRVAEGVVELLGNGSGFLRVEEGGEDVYISAAQVKRCELVAGDRVSGPVRPPRRSERHPSLVRIDTINGRPADEVAEGTRFEDLAVTWPTERIALDEDDVTLKAVEWLTPFGLGSRVVIAGGARAGKTELARGIARRLAGRDGLELVVVLAGARPEEIADWEAAGVVPSAALSFAASADAQAQIVEQAIDQGRRVAARGGDAVVVVDSLEHLSPSAARKALAAARKLAQGGSLTVVATAPEPLGGETTVVRLDAELTGLRRFPALDLVASGTLRPELLVGEAGAEAIAKARADSE